MGGKIDEFKGKSSGGPQGINSEWKLFNTKTLFVNSFYCHEWYKSTCFVYFTLPITQHVYSPVSADQN